MCLSLPLSISLHLSPSLPASSPLSTPPPPLSTPLYVSLHPFPLCVGNNNSKSLVRFEFVETIIRIAMAMYCAGGSCGGEIEKQAEIQRHTDTDTQRHRERLWVVREGVWRSLYVTNDHAYSKLTGAHTHIPTDISILITAHCFLVIAFCSLLSLYVKKVPRRLFTSPSNGYGITIFGGTHGKP